MKPEFSIPASEFSIFYEAAYLKEFSISRVQFSKNDGKRPALKKTSAAQPKEKSLLLLKFGFILCFQFRNSLTFKPSKCRTGKNGKPNWKGWWHNHSCKSSREFKIHSWEMLLFRKFRHSILEFSFDFRLIRSWNNCFSWMITGSQTAPVAFYKLFSMPFPPQRHYTTEAACLLRPCLWKSPTLMSCWNVTSPIR